MDVKKTTPEKPSLPIDTRRTVRRKNTDRRTETRFEPDKENRRQHKGRRSTDEDIWGSK
jgi:hypothetical protein